MSEVGCRDLKAPGKVKGLKMQNIKIYFLLFNQTQNECLIVKKVQSFELKKSNMRKKLPNQYHMVLEKDLIF